MKTYAAALLILLFALVPMSAYADVITLENVSYSAPTALGGGPNYVDMTVSLPEISAKTILAYAELQFEAALDPGVEIELWEDTGSETRPWDLENTENVSRAPWVMDKDGAPLVRFDITKLAQDWANQSKTNHGVLIRLRPGQEVQDVSLKETPKIKVIYHVLSADQ